MDIAKKRLGLIWFLGVGLFYLLVVILILVDTIVTPYIKEIFSWCTPLLIPTLSLMVGVYVAESKKTNLESRMVDNFYYYLAVILSIVYISVVMMVLLLSPFYMTRYKLPEMMIMSNYFIGPLQGLVTGILVIFFKK